MPQGVAAGCTCRHSTACVAVVLCVASRYAKSVGQTCGGGTTVRTHAHEHVACMSFSIMNVSTHMAHGKQRDVA